MGHRIFFSICLAMLALQCGKSAETLPLGALLHDGPSTPEQISLYLPVSGPLATNAIAHVRYRQEPGGSWLDGHPLHRIRPEFSSSTVPDAFAGVITDLKPGIRYSVEVTVSNGNNVETKLLNHTTRSLPPRSGVTTIKIEPGSTSTQIQAVFDALKPGAILELADGAYDVDNLQLNQSGTISQPIVIRGASRSGAILRAAKGPVIHFVRASNTVIERLTMEGSKSDSGTSSSSQGIRFWNGAPHPNVTIRDITIRGVDQGIVSWGALSAALIYDCTLVGNNVWTQPFLESNATWNDDGIRIPGTGNVAFNNTLTGFGDSFAVLDGVESNAVHFYRNEVLMTGDDAFEGDYAKRNITFYDNRIHNSMTFVSFDPLRGGPAFVFRNISINTGRQPYKLNATNTGFFFYSNTIVRTQGYGSGKGWGWNQSHNGSIRGWGYRNNILIFRGKGNLLAMESSGQDPIDFTHNAWFPDGSVWWTRSGGSFRSLAEARDKLPPKTPVFGTSTHRHEQDLISTSDPFEVIIELGETYLTEVKKPYAPVLASGSPLRNAGTTIPGITDGFSGKAPDIGAVITGRPLPQWGDRLAGGGTPPLPPTNLIVR